ncbi:MAG: anaerobic carbon-monoxide dehydrogenase catalytic subunit [bacterium]
MLKRDVLHGPVSVHESVQEMHERISADGLSSTFNRYNPQAKIRCNFCREGISCQLCSNGPCRISTKADAELGVCGIDADAMAMRNMLLRNVMGTSTYAHHAYEAFRTLKSTAEGKTPFSITDIDKLNKYADQLGLSPGSDTNGTAVQLADFLIDQLSHSYDEPTPLIELFAPEPRRKLWQDLAIYPAGVMHEIKDSTASCLTNVDGDYFSLARKAMRLGIACIYGAQLPLEMVQDILFGTPMPHEVDVDLGIMDPDYVNIVFNGHEPWVGVATYLAAKKPAMQEKAKAAGAKGLRVIGSIESGQEVLQRFEQDEVFRGLTGNWLTIEPLLATGTVDVFAMDENCSPPNLTPYADKYQVTLVAVSDLVRMPGVDKHLDYKPTEATYIAEQLIDLAVRNFGKRHGKIKPVVPARIQKAIAGFSPEAVLKALGGGLDPLVEVIKDGKIKGVVALINCTTLSNGPHDYMTVNLAKELISRDILIVAAGCGNHALEVAGLCNLEALGQAGPGLKEVGSVLGIPPVLSFGTCTDTGRISLLVTALANHLGLDIPDLPIAVTAPQYLEQKATIDALFALAYGTYTHLSPAPPVIGGEKLVKLLTEELEEITGGKIALGDQPREAADGIEEHINKKRQALGM